MTHTRRVRPSPADDGIATVWAAAGVAIIMGALLVGLYLGGAIAARHRAEAAADLAALAAAGLAVQGRDAACDRAGDIARAMGGEVTSCQLSGWDALVQVRVAVPMALVGADAALGRARAGPADTDPLPPPPAREEGSEPPTSAESIDPTIRQRTSPQGHWLARPLTSGHPSIITVEKVSPNSSKEVPYTSDF
ncbi:MAG: Rv3654c family TadE-like protein [Pseudonocardia sp.]